MMESSSLISEDQTFNCDSLLLERLAVPVPDLENARLKALRETCVLDSNLKDPEFDRYTTMVSRIFNVPIAVVSLIDVDRQWFKSCVGLSANQTHRNDAFCSYTILPQTDDVMVVYDTFNDERFRENVLVTGPPFIRFYAGAALFVNGMKVGSLCAIDTVPRPDFDLNKQMSLMDIGSMISSCLSRRRNSALNKSNARANAIINLMRDLQTPLDSIKSALAELESNANIPSPAKATISSMSAYLRAIGTDIEANLSLAPIVLKKQPVCKEKTSLNVPTIFNLIECNILSIVDKAKNIILGVSGSSHIEWLVDDAYLKEQPICYPDVVLYVFLSAISRLVKSWLNVSVFVGFRKKFILEDETTANENIYDGKLCIDVRASGKIDVSKTPSQALPNDACLSSTANSVALLNNYYSVENILRDLGGHVRELDLSQIEDNNSAYLGEMEYEFIANRNQEAKQKAGLELLLSKGKVEVERHCEYLIPCQIKTSLLPAPGNRYHVEGTRPDSLSLNVMLICKNLASPAAHSLVEVLSGFGASVSASDRVDYAVDKLLAGKHAVLILDVSLTHSSGAPLLQYYRNRRMQLTASLHNHVSYIPRVLLLGVDLESGSNEDTIRSSFAHGLNYFIPNPFSEDKESLRWILSRCSPHAGFSNNSLESFSALTEAIGAYLAGKNSKVVGLQNMTRKK